MSIRSYVDLNFCNVYYRGKFPDKTKNLIIKAYKNNKKFFDGRRIPQFKIIFVYSRKEINKLWGAKTANYVSGFSKKKKIIIFPPEIIEKETCWKKSDFYSTLSHEINHLFFINLAKTHKPLWLLEGVASYIQSKRKRSKKLKIPFSILGNNFNNCGVKAYDYAQLFVSYLIKTYKKGKLIRLIISLKDNKRNTQKLFNKIYNKSPEELIKDANAI